MKKIRVLYLEDDPDWRKGIAQFFKAHEQIEVYACVSSISECMGLLRNEPTDAVILDIMLSTEETGLDAALDISKQYPHVKIIMLSSLHDNDEIFNEAFLNGAYDYLYKHDFEKLPQVILEAVQQPHNKYGVRLRRLVLEKKQGLLTEGDRELLIELLKGKTQQQIADAGYVSLGAVKKKINRLVKKFNWQRSSLELAQRCEKWGLLDN